MNPMVEISDIKRREASDALRLEMEALSVRLKDLVLSQPPCLLLGYLWSELLMSVLEDNDTDIDSKKKNMGQRDCHLIALEYVHAILSCFEEPVEQLGEFREETAAEIQAIAERLRWVSLSFCMESSGLSDNSEFGDQTGQIEYNAKATWVLIRGNRYQVLEEEFFNFVLEPHDEALRRTYGVGARDVATGIQAIATSMREGFARAVEEIDRQRNLTSLLMDGQGISLEDAIERLKRESPDVIASAQGAIKDLFWGGLCNLSRHTKLPEYLLDDLSYRRGENKEFFELGEYCGTPLRTLPARIKPLVKLDDGYYATDPQFVRDSTYRALQRGLKERLPDYKEEWNRRQKILAENAFARILSNQLQRASVLNEVYYRDSVSGDWAESDALVILEDVLVLVEAKAGIGVMESPATNFGHHVRAIQNLVVKAYRQTKRFLDYLSSSPEVPLFELRSGKHVEIRRIRISDFRLILPIGLTVESFAPFSAMCKELKEIEALLGKFPFISMSIDDLFVLNRFLPTAGELFHYLGVRQLVAGIRGAQFFDEIDHLGAYIEKNRFDLTLHEQFAEGATWITWDGSCEEVDGYFEGDKWLHEDPPSQIYPPLLTQLLRALAKTGARGWLRFDAMIRDLGSEARENLEQVLRDLAASLKIHEHRWFALMGESPLMIWFSRDNTKSDLDSMIRKAEIVALSVKVRDLPVLRACLSSASDVSEASGAIVRAPTPIRKDYRELICLAEEVRQKPIAEITAVPKRLPPNEPCWCRSGKKFKKCHGSPQVRI
jgi:hypothetical protein